MKNDISYKSLIIGSAVYILCGLVINYLFGVGDVLSEQAIAAGEKEPPLLFGDNFLLYLFFIYGGYTFTFYAFFFYMIRKNKMCIRDSCKVCHISGNTDHQALMLFRIYLGIFKRVGIHNIDLDVLSALSLIHICIS